MITLINLFTEDKTIKEYLYIKYYSLRKKYLVTKKVDNWCDIEELYKNICGNQDAEEYGLTITLNGIKIELGLIGDDGVIEYTEYGI